jgi:hypothetical protein
MAEPSSSPAKPSYSSNLMRNSESNADITKTFSNGSIAKANYTTEKVSESEMPTTSVMAMLKQMEIKKDDSVLKVIIVN